MYCNNCVKKDVCEYKEVYIQNTEKLNKLVGNREQGKLSFKELTLPDCQSVFIRCKFHLSEKIFLP